MISASVQQVAIMPQGKEKSQLINKMSIIELCELRRVTHAMEVIKSEAKEVYTND